VAGTTRGRLGAAPIVTVTGLTVSPVTAGARGGPITVAATVPAGAKTVRIRVVRRKGAHWQRVVGTVFRSTPKAKRYTFRLTERALRGLRAGRYVVEVRIGASRTALGPAAKKTITVRKARARR
jgi:hypothetical protein